MTARAIERFLRTALENRRNVVRDALARARHVPAGSPRDVVLADILPAGGHETAGAVLLVTLGPNLVRSTHLAQAPRTPDEACDLIGAAVERVVAGAGENSQLAVRHVRTAQALRTRFPDCDVVATTELPALDAFAGAGGASPGARRAFVGADQRLAAPLRDDLVAAALACFRDHPWRWAEPAQLVHAQGTRPTEPPSASWWVSFGGGARSVPSVTLAQDRADLDAELQGRAPDALTPLVSVTYLVDTGGQATTLFAVRGCPGGALDAEEVAGLALVMRNAARFVARHQADLRGEPGTSFPISDARELDGLRLSCRGYSDLDDASPLKSGTLRWGSTPEWPTWLAGLEAWLVGRGLSADEVRWHCADAECLADFAGAGAITPADLHEADVRRFLYDWLPRQESLSPDDVLSAVASLALLFEMAAHNLGLRASWIHPLLADRDALMRRCRRYPGAGSAAALREWQHELDTQLARRVMAIPPELVRADVTSGVTAIERHWLAWREELIESGATNPSSVRAALTRRARAALSG